MAAAALSLTCPGVSHGPKESDSLLMMVVSGFTALHAAGRDSPRFTVSVFSLPLYWLFLWLCLCFDFSFSLISLPSSPPNVTPRQGRVQQTGPSQMPTVHPTRGQRKGVSLTGLSWPGEGQGFQDTGLPKVRGTEFSRGPRGPVPPPPSRSRSGGGV